MLQNSTYYAQNYTGIISQVYLLLMAIIFPYSNSIAIVTSLAVLPLYYWILLYNRLMITSRPNVVVIPLYHDSDY